MPPRRHSLQNEPKVTVTNVDPDSDFHEEDEAAEDYSEKIDNHIQKNLLKVPALKANSSRRHSIAASSSPTTERKELQESPRRYSLDLGPTNVSSIMSRTSEDFKKVLKDMNFKFVLEDIEDNEDEIKKKNSSRSKKIIKKNKKEQPNSGRKQVRWSNSTHKNSIFS